MEQSIKIEVNIESLDVGALIDLEEATTTKQVVAWLAAHTNVTLDALRAVPLNEFLPLASQIAEQVKGIMQPPKASGRR